MKLLRYGPLGQEKPGLLDAAGVLRDLSAHVADLGGAVLADLDRLRAVDPASLPVVPGNPRLGACVTGTGKFICIGLNYADHAAESGMQVPPEPVIFMKATSAICGPHDPILIPRGSEKTDWEVELGIVIGRAAKYVPANKAVEYIFGYMVTVVVCDIVFGILASIIVMYFSRQREFRADAGAAQLLGQAPQAGA